jgi:hypothetical protein
VKDPNCDEFRCQLRAGHAGLHYGVYHMLIGGERVQYVDEWGDVDPASLPCRPAIEGDHCLTHGDACDVAPSLPEPVKP